MKEFIDNPSCFKELNQLIGTHRLHYYFDIEKVKSYLVKTNAMLEDSYASEELLSGL